MKEKIKKVIEKCILFYTYLPVYIHACIIFGIMVLISYWINSKFFNENTFDEPNIFDSNDIVIMNPDETIQNNTSNNQENKVEGELKEILKAKPRIRRKVATLKRDDTLEDVSMDYFFGVNEAPITIIEYSNLNSPHCLTLHQNIMEQLKTEYIDTGKVKYIKRLVMQNDTILGVLLTYCAKNNQNRYTLLDDLYKNAKIWTKIQGQKNRLRVIAMRNGFTEEEYNACIRNTGLAKRLLKKSQTDLASLNIKSTPTIIINGDVFTGVMTYDELSEHIKQKIIDLNTENTNNTN